MSILCQRKKAHEKKGACFSAHLVAAAPVRVACNLLVKADAALVVPGDRIVRAVRTSNPGLYTKRILVSQLLPTFVPSLSW